MTMRQVAILGTSGLIAGLAAVFSISGWEQADRVVSVVSALTAVEALGLGVWLVLSGGRPLAYQGRSPVAAGTTTALRMGTATASGSDSRANTGISGGLAAAGGVTSAATGDARATGSGIANSGVDHQHDA